MKKSIRILLTIIKRYQNILMLLLLLSVITVTVRLYPHPHLSEKLSYSTAYYDHQNKLLRFTLASDDRYRSWTSLEDISPYVIDGFLLHEDQWFYYHPGFNPFSLIRAFVASYLGAGNRQGASTITMQLARMYWQLNTKTIDGKLYQIMRAVQLELMYSKHDILEAYLNYAPFGRNIESVGAAALIYFDKPASKLNLPEALTLAVLPQSPTYRIDRNTGFAGEALVKARNQLFERWKITYEVDAYTTALFYQPLVLRQPEKLPFLAPHFVDQIIKSEPISSQSVVTTLDTNLQQIMETQIQQFVERNKSRGIYNASAILVDTKTMGVRALVGSSNYFNPVIHGQVNGTNAKRSPGSTLKPFIYALGLDQGVIHPMSILRDVETDFGAYTPENFDRKFQGPITATTALIKSRNIPAVHVASKLKSPSLYEFLQAAEIKQLAPESHYGLALVLGGGEVTSQELATLYAMLANQGKWQSLQFLSQSLREENQQDSKSLISAEAAFITLDMLGQNTRKQDILVKMQNNTLPVYWKTGTSWGFRDAWTAGNFGPYVLVVWLGNFDGSSNNAFVGADAATPLFFNLIDSITAYNPTLKAPINEIPNNLKRVEICLVSGHLVTKWCKTKGYTWFIPGVSPITVDTIFRPVRIDNETGKVACAPYDLQNTHIEIFEFWPSDLAQVFAKAGLPKRQPPTNEHCGNLLNNIGEKPSITSPLKNVVYQFSQSKSKNERIPFLANTDGDVKSLYWFVNDHYLGQTSVSDAFDWTPTQSGRFRILVVDDAGRSDARIIRVDLLD